MLASEERRALYWIAKHAFSGAGAIIDAGAFLGASAVSLAAGADRSGKARLDGPTIYSYDYFAAIDEYVVEFIARDIRPIVSGESYLDIFQQQTKNYSALIEARAGDFLEQRWDDRPVEILFVDIAKTRDLNSHVVELFFPRLLPGKSTVIQQDFYHIWHPYIHITMEYLADYFDIEDTYVEAQSRVYRYVQQIPEAALRRVIDYDFQPEERRFLLRQAAARSQTPVKEMLQAMLVYQCALDGDDAAFDRELAAIERLHPDFRTRPELWATQLMEIISKRQHIRHWTV